MAIGTFAYCGSGQDTLADSICRYYNYKKFTVGDIIRKIAEERGISKNRDSLRNIRKEIDNAFGREYLPNLLVQNIRNDSANNLIITGIRTIQEYNIFNKEFDIKLIFVKADEEIRFERMLNRKEEKDEKTLIALKQQMKKEVNYFDYKKLESLAYLTFNFNMPLPAYIRDEKKIIEELIYDMGEM